MGIQATGIWSLGIKSQCHEYRPYWLLAILKPRLYLNDEVKLVEINILIRTINLIVSPLTSL
jgi:hypothetical protein